METPLITAENETKAEMAFRRAAGLCLHCGMAWPARASLVCENCEEQAQIEPMEAQWRAWGIAA